MSALRGQGSAGFPAPGPPLTCIESSSRRGSSAPRTPVSRKGTPRHGARSLAKVTPLRVRTGFLPGRCAEPCSCSRIAAVLRGRCRPELVPPGGLPAMPGASRAGLGLCSPGHLVAGLGTSPGAAHTPRFSAPPHCERLTLAQLVTNSASAPASPPPPPTKKTRLLASGLLCPSANTQRHQHSAPLTAWFFAGS